MRTLLRRAFEDSERHQVRGHIDRVRLWVSSALARSPARRDELLAQLDASLGDRRDVPRVADAIVAFLAETDAELSAAAGLDPGPRPADTTE